VRQRNTSGSPLVLPTLDPPVEVLPGDEIDFPNLLAGMESLEDEQSEMDEAESDNEDPEEQAAPAARDEQAAPATDDDQAAPSAETDEEVSQ
jgi:hypothetical protein